MRRATIVVALVELGAAVLAFGARRVTGAPALAAVLGIGLLASSWSESPRAPRLGLNEVRDGVGGELRVIDRNGARYLLADGTIHTVLSTDDYSPLTRSAAALELLKLLHPGTDSVLVIGMRGGAVPRAFARDGWTVHVVEADADEASVAARWLSLQPADARVTVSDPRVFLRQHPGTYPLIVLDVFGDSVIPFHLASAQFVDLLAAHLRPDGIVAIPVETQGWDDVVARSLAATLRRRFRVVQALPTSEPPNTLGTVVLVASNRVLEIPDERLPDPSNFHSDPEGQWVVQQITHAWLNRFEPEPKGAQILTDDGRAVDLWTERLNAASRRELHAFFGAGARSW
jgi:spermidine synthase